jgi:hypothetical protein
VLTTTASLIVQLVMMLGASVLAAITARRGWRVESELAST